MFYYLNIVYLLKVSNKYVFIEHDRSLPNSFLAFTGGQSLCCNILATVSSFPKKRQIQYKQIDVSKVFKLKSKI